MIAPLSWLKQYIDITLKPEELALKLTEVGLGVEAIKKEKDDIIFDLEITPNRPDWLSMIGVAREIAAIENKKIKYPHLKTDVKPEKNTKLLPLTIHPNFSCSERMTGILITGVHVTDSPKWLKDRLTSIGLRPINNIVDITNFVMWELGNPIHSFDYDKIAESQMWVKQAKGGEAFESVDDISYHLPKGAIIYEDKEKIFDLAGIKGGKNSGTYNDTKTVFILVAVDNPILIRKASQALALRSDASAIFERAVNKGGTVDALKRTVDLILETAGGEVASELIDLKEKEFEPWKLSLRLERLNALLGITIPEKDVMNLLNRLNLSPSLRRATATKQSHGDHHASLATTQGSIIECTIPTYRNDLQIEEDLIEEVARLYGYNNFPKTMISGPVATEEIPYFKNYKQDEEVKNILTAAGFSEVYTYSLISESDLTMIGVNPEQILRVDNPVSRDFEYLRPTLKANLVKALEENKANFKDINLFELGKVYKGKSLDKTEESYMLSAITNSKNYYQVKGLLEIVFEMLGVKENPTDFIELTDEGVFFEVNYTKLLEKPRHEKIYKSLPKYPSSTEDLALVVANEVKTGDIITKIKEQSVLITHVSLLDQFENTRTFHIIYQSKEKNLTSEDVSEVREKIIKSLEKAYSAKVK